MRIGSKEAPTSEFPNLHDPAWGPPEPRPVVRTRRIANDVCAGSWSQGRLVFAGGALDALALFRGNVVRMAEPDETVFGLAQVRRVIRHLPLHLVHVVFAPITPRPLLLGLVRVYNISDDPERIDYSELWGVQGTDHHAAVGASVCETDQGERVLADASSVVRANPPDRPGNKGLALDLHVVVPPRSHRQFCFAYAAPEPGDTAALLVRAWRGGVPAELERTVRLLRGRKHA